MSGRAARDRGIEALLGASLGRPARRYDAATVLEVASREGLALQLVLDEVGISTPPEWLDAVAAEGALRASHRETAPVVVEALGTLAASCAWSDPLWRRGSTGSSVGVLVPRWAWGEATARLTAAGLVHLSRLDLPGSALLVRTTGPDVSDVVVVEALEAGDRVDHGPAVLTAPPAGSCQLGELTAKAALRRVLEGVGRAGRARLVDLADIELSGWSLPLPPLPPALAPDGPAGRGLVLVEQAKSFLAGGATATAPSTRVATARSGARERLGVVAFTGPAPARDRLADRLAESLRRAGVVTRLVRLAGTTALRSAAGARRAVRSVDEGVVVLVGDLHDPVEHSRRPAPAGGFASRALRELAPAADVTVTVLEPGGDPRPPVLDPACVPVPWLSDQGVPVVASPDTDRAAEEALRVVFRRLLVRAETVGRHPGLWRVLAPLDVEGPVVIANLGRIRTENLQHTYPRAVALARDMVDVRDVRRGVVWDGSRPPLRPSASDLVVVDDRQGGALEALAPARRSRGGSVALVPASRPFDYVVYPQADYPLLITRQEWPTWSAGASIRLRLARWRVRTPLWRLRGRDALRVDAPGRSLAAVVLSDVADRSGAPAGLHGVLVGRGRGQMTLRAHLGGDEIAVRMGLTPRGVERLRAHEAAERRLEGQEERLGLAAPRVILAGQVAGVEWVAEEWLAGRSGPGGGPWSPRGGWGWEVTRDAAASLGSELVTGHVGDGWARRWAAPLAAVADEHLEEIVEVLDSLEQSRMQTSWSHGDLWPGNVFLRGRQDPPLVIDWDRGSDDAPSGLDAVFLEIVRFSLLHQATIGASAGSMVLSGAPSLDLVPIGGKAFGEWPPEVRRGLVVASFLRTASGGSVDRPTWSELWVEENLMPVVAACRRARWRRGQAQTG